MKVAIIEDEMLVADYIRTIVTNLGFTVVGIAGNLAQANTLLEKEPDLVLLDIHLENNDSGILFGERLTIMKIPFIYITANTDTKTLKAAVKTKPFSYLSKPFNDNDIIASLVLVESNINNKNYYLNVKTKQGTEHIEIRDVLYVEADNVYVHIYTTKKKVTQRITLKEFIDNVDNDCFIRVHRSYVVNKNHISSAATNYVMVNGTKIACSRVYKSALKSI